MDTWAALLKAAEESKILQVRLSPGARIQKPKRPRGRPRVRGATRYGHYAGYRPDEGGRPRCRMSGCTNYLKRHQAIACCDNHREKCLHEARMVLQYAANEETLKPRTP